MNHFTALNIYANINFGREASRDTHVSCCLSGCSSYLTKDMIYKHGSDKKKKHDRARLTYITNGQKGAWSK